MLSSNNTRIKMSLHQLHNTPPRAPYATTTTISAVSGTWLRLYSQVSSTAAASPHLKEDPLCIHQHLVLMSGLLVFSHITTTFPLQFLKHFQPETLTTQYHRESAHLTQQSHQVRFQTDDERHRNQKTCYCLTRSAD